MQDWFKPVPISSLPTHIIWFLPLTFHHTFKGQQWLQHHQFFFSLSSYMSTAFHYQNSIPPSWNSHLLCSCGISSSWLSSYLFEQYFSVLSSHLQLSKYTPRFSFASSLSKFAFWKNSSTLTDWDYFHNDSNSEFSLELPHLISECLLDSFSWIAHRSLPLSYPELNLLSFTSPLPIIYIPILEE